MKNLLKFAALAIVLAGCSKENISETGTTQTTPANYVTLDGTADFAGSRVELVDGKSLHWSSGDELAVVEFVDGVLSDEAPTAVIEEGGASASFSAELAAAKGDEYKYYAVYPADAYVDTDDSSLNLILPNKQTPTSDFADPAAAILVGESEVQAAQGGEVAFTFKHAAAYLRLTIKGIPEGRTVQTVTVSAADKTIAGAYSYALGEQAENNAGEFSKIKLNAENLSADASGDYTVWVAIQPDVELTGLEVTAGSEGLIFYDSWSGEASVSAGHVKSLTFNVDDERMPEDAELAFPDPIFRAYVLKNFDTDNDGKISQDEALKPKSIDVSNSFSDRDNDRKTIKSLEGVQYFTNLTGLYCTYNKLAYLDISKNTELTALWCEYNQLTSLDVSRCTALTELNCSSYQLTSLDVSGCTALKELTCFNNQLTTLDVSGCTALTKLSCSSNQLTSLDVSKNTALEELYCSSSQLTSLEVGNNTKLTRLECWSNQLTSLDVSGCTALTTLWCYDNQLTDLDVSGCTALTLLNCQSNQLTDLDASECTALKELTCHSNQLTSLDVSGCTALIRVVCYYNQIEELDLSNTNLANGSYNTTSYGFPLECAPMETLKKVYLKKGWSIKGITGDNRGDNLIPQQTEIIFVE